MYTPLSLGRDEVDVDAEDLRSIAPMALRLRRSVFMNEYFDGQKGEEDELKGLLNKLSGSRVKRKTQ